jgi:CRISPR-associated protein Cas1
MVYLSRGSLSVQNGTLLFVTAGNDSMPPGEYHIPFQQVSIILLGPGSTISHDALRILARHGTGLIVTGEHGVRYYASMPFGPDDSRLARRQVAAWSDMQSGRVEIARRMYAWRLGEIFPSRDIEVLRGMEGARARQMYQHIASKYGIRWYGRRYDRSNPNAADVPNQAVNHASTAVEGAALIAVNAVGAIPQLGFIHEDSGVSFCLDIADLFRDEITLPVAFQAASIFKQSEGGNLESITRKLTGTTLHHKKVIAKMIDRIKSLFEDDGVCDDEQR